MGTPISPLYNKVAHLTNEVHAADAIEENGVWQGVVRHGNASTTTLLKDFPTKDNALSHAQVFADELNAATEKKKAQKPN